MGRIPSARFARPTREFFNQMTIHSFGPSTRYVRRPSGSTPPESSPYGLEEPRETSTSETSSEGGKKPSTTGCKTEGQAEPSPMPQGSLSPKSDQTSSGRPRKS